MIEFSQYQTTTLTINLKEVLEMLAIKYPDKFKGNESISGKVTIEKCDWDGDYTTHETISADNKITLTIKTLEV